VVPPPKSGDVLEGALLGDAMYPAEVFREIRMAEVDWGEEARGVDETLADTGREAGHMMGRNEEDREARW